MRQNPIAAEIDRMHFTKKDIQYIAVIIASSLLYAFGMNSFVKSGNLFPGGFAGLSRLLSAVCNTFLHINISFSVFYFVLNFLVTILVFRRIGHKFILYSVIWYSLTSFFTSVLKLPVITHEILLIAVFGGLINGFAIGLALQSNASSGGTDFIAIWLSMKFNKETWNYMLAANAVILVIAGCLYGWSVALYSIIFQYVSTQVVNTMHQRYKLTTLDIVTNMPDEVCTAIFHTCRHGITKIKCEGGFTDQVHWMLITTINTYQLKEVVENVRKADEHAFIAINSVEKIYGNYYQKPID